MAQPDPKDAGSRRAVGVYDRPAKADRPRALTIVVIVVLVVVAVVGTLVLLR